MNSVLAKRPFLLLGGGGWSPEACHHGDFAQRNDFVRGCAFRFQI